MDKQAGEPDDVRVGHDVGKEGRHRPEEGQRQLRHVVEMTRNAPVAGHQQKAGMRSTIGQHVFRSDQLRCPTPNQALPVGSANLELLAIGGVVDQAAGHAGGKNDNRPEETKFDRPRGQVHAHRCIHARDETEAAPADVEPCPVEHYVDGPHVPRLPPEELREVDHMQRGGHPDTVDEAVQLVVLQTQFTSTYRNAHRGRLTAYEMENNGKDQLDRRRKF